MFWSSIYQQKTIKNFQKFLAKGFEKSVYWNEYKTKSENKNTINEYRYFLKSNFAGVNRLFVLVYLNTDKDVKTLKTQKYYLLKVLSTTITSLSLEKTSMTNPLILI